MVDSFGAAKRLARECPVNMPRTTNSRVHSQFHSRPRLPPQLIDASVAADLAQADPRPVRPLIARPDRPAMQIVRVEALRVTRARPVQPVRDRATAIETVGQRADVLISHFEVMLHEHERPAALPQTLDPGPVVEHPRARDADRRMVSTPKVALVGKVGADNQRAQCRTLYTTSGTILITPPLSRTLRIISQSSASMFVHGSRIHP